MKKSWNEVKIERKIGPSEQFVRYKTTQESGGFYCPNPSVVRSDEILSRTLALPSDYFEKKNTCKHLGVIIGSDSF